MPVTVSETIPAKWLVGLMVIVEVAAAPASVLMLGGVDVIV